MTSLKGVRVTEKQQEEQNMTDNNTIDYLI